MSLTHTTIDNGPVMVRDGEFKDDTLTFAGEATVKPGTILARDSSTLKLVPFVKGGSTNENGIPKAVITYSVSRGSAGDEGVRAMIRGVVNADRLIIHGDGDGENVDEAVLDALRNYGITPVDVAQLGQVDNPQPGVIDS